MNICDTRFNSNWDLTYIDEDNYRALMTIDLTNTAQPIDGVIFKDGIPDGTFKSNEVECSDDGFALRFRYVLGTQHEGVMTLILFDESPNILTGEYVDDGAGDTGYVEATRIP